MSFKSVALSAAKQAGKVLLKYYGKREWIKEKPNKSFVAAADLEANKVIIDTIKKYYPSHNILSEESPYKNNHSDYKWVIDPLDGTHNFLHNIPIFGTSIALEYKDEVILGVLHFPLLKITAVAEKGKYAFVDGKRIKVSEKSTINHSFIVTEFAFANRKQKINFLSRLMHSAIDVRNYGSAIYGLLLIASGKCDGYVILSTHEWDVAAGFLLVEEAGGKITDLKGNRYKLHENQFVVSNGKIHSQLLNYVR